MNPSLSDQTLPSAPLALAAVVIAGLVMAGCGDLGHAQSSADCIGPSADPVSMIRSWSQGAAFAVATIGEQRGSTRVYDPGYPADLYDVAIEQVVVNTTDADPAEVTQIANVHYPPNNECPVVPTAELEPGSRMLLVLGPPDPSKDVWTVDGAPALLALRNGPTGEEVIWHGPSSACPGDVSYSVDAIARAGAAPGRTGATGTCLPT